jgi:hypothetical protein
MATTEVFTTQVLAVLLVAAAEPVETPRLLRSGQASLLSSPVQQPPMAQVVEHTV